MKKLGQIALISISISSILFALKTDIRFEHITINDGLSQSSVRAIHKDQTGFMWFGTNDGLNRYDGYSFKIFVSDISDTTSISNSQIFDIAEDENGFLWIATSDGLNQYDKFSESFRRINFSKTLKRNELSNAIISVACRKENARSFIWFTTRDGIFRYNRETNIIRFYEQGEVQTTNERDIRSFIHINSNNVLRVVTNMDGIYEYNPSEDSFARIFFDESENAGEDIQLSQMYEDGEGYLWFGSINGLNKFNLITRELVIYKKRFEEAVGRKFNTNFINDITEDDQNNLWLATSGFGLICFNKLNEDIRVYSHDPFDGSSISLDVAHTVYYDDTGILWIGTHGKGIDKYNPYLNNFKLVKQSKDCFSINSVRTFAEDYRGKIWISGYNGLDLLDPSTGRFTGYFSGKGSLTKLDAVVYSIKMDKNEPKKYMYLGTEGSGIYKFDFRNETFSKLYHSDHYHGDNLIFSLYDDSTGNLWAGTINGLLKFDKVTGAATKYTHDPNNTKSLSPQSVTALYEDSFGNFWVGTNEGGLNLFDRAKGEFHSYKVQDNLTLSSISSNNIKCIFEDSKKNLWVGTANGLNRFDIQNQSFKKYFTRDGLPNNVVYGIVEDEEGYLWISTNYGISRFDPAEEKFYNYTYQDGLQSNEFNTNAYFESSNGEIFFGGINGYNSFFPDEIKINKNVPPVVNTDFKLFGSSLSIGDIVNDRVLITQSVVTANMIELFYSENVFTFEFSALDFSFPGKNMYSYKLEGFDRDWSLPGIHRTVTYTNLNPGKYTFRVRGANNDSIWNPEGASVIIRVLPPFWLTWWFFALVVLLISVIIYYLVRLKIAKVLEVERIRTGIASDLHDDIGSTLSKLALRADMIEQSIENVKLSSGLKRIAEMSREAVSSMSDIVWSIDSRNDSIESTIHKMKDFAFGVLTDKEIQVNFDVRGFDKPQSIPVELRQNLYLIFKESVNNIVKHSNADKVDIRLKELESKYIMTVKDNGTSFKEKQFSVGQGLKNMKLRAERIRAKLEYNDNGDGFLVTLTGKLE